MSVIKYKFFKSILLIHSSLAHIVNTVSNVFSINAQLILRLISIIKIENGDVGDISGNPRPVLQKY